MHNHNNAQVRSYDALDNLTQYEFDRNNRQVAVIDPSGNRSSQTYDSVGNISTKTDGRGNRTSYSYDEFNRLTAVTNAKNEVTSYTYDNNGNMLTQIDARGNTATFEYNVMNLPARRIDHGGRTGTAGSYTYDSAKTEVYTYNADGSLKTKIDRNGITTNYTYDIHGRLKKQTCGASVISYTYDNNGNQTTITDGTGTTTRSYDELNRVVTKSVPGVGITVFEYDIIEGVDAGCWAETSQDPKGNVTTKEYDRVGRLKRVTADGKTTTYTYYDNGSTQSLVYHDGSREDYTYYPNGRLWTLKNKKANGTVIDEYAYEYDAAGNQTRKTDGKGITSYTYDALNRLETVTEPDGTVTSYTFDRSGNRATETVASGTDRTVNVYVYNEQNRLTTVTTKLNGTVTATTAYVYDNNGNQLTTAVNGTTAVTNTYDELNQLISTLSNGTLVNMRYNGEGYRVEKIVTGAVTKYLYEYDKVVLELDGSGKQTGRNVYGTNLLMRTADDTTYYYMYNGHADVTALLTPDGTIAGTYYYDAFGNITEQTGDVSNSITYVGYQYDEETGLYYLNARMYDPKIARFLQEDTYRGQQNDPLSLNLYAYCANEPIKYWDPTGHLYFDGKEWRSQNSDNIEVVESQQDYYTRHYTEQANKDSGQPQETGNARGLVTLQDLDDFGFYMGLDPSERQANLTELNRVLQDHNINTPLRIAFFLGQVAHESSFGSRTLEKFNGSSPETYFTNKYSNNSGLGNKGGNDGELFRGSGYIQITGRDNYQGFADYINDQSIMTDGYRLIGGVYNKPVSRIQPGEIGVIDVGKYAWEAAGWFWEYGSATGKDLNSMADNKDYRGVLNGINSYDTGSLQKRNSNTNKIYKILTGSELGLPK